MNRIEERLREIERARPELIRLAEAVSLAVLIDPPLLRKARLALVPEADAGVEADLWLSPLVQNYGPDGIVLSPEIAEALRAGLAKDPERLRRAREITDSLHQHLSPAVRLEEEIAWLSVSPDPRAADRIEELLRSVLAAMVGGERRGLAHWAARALPSLPSGVRIRAAETLRMLDAGARLRLGEGVKPADEKEKMPDWLPWVAPADLPRTPVRVRLFPDAVELDARPEATGNLLQLPETDPLLVELSWDDEKKKERRQVVFRKGEVRRVEPVRAKNICVWTILGELYDLRESHQPPRGLRDDLIDFSQERSRYRPFFGRRAVLAQIEEWIAGSAAEPERDLPIQRTGSRRTARVSRISTPFQARGLRSLIVVGDAGTGKTALLSHMIDRLQERLGAPPPHHFFRRGEPRLEDLGSAERSLVAQIAAHFPALATAAARLPLADLLDQLSWRNLISSERPLILILDGLDQARRSRGTNPLNLLFPQNLPAGTFLLASWEAEPLASPSAEWPARIYVRAEEEDLLEYWEHYYPQDSSWAIENSRLAQLSEHNFGAAEILRRRIEYGLLERDLSGGLSAMNAALEPIWEDLATGETVGGELVALGLGALAVSFGPIPEAVLVRVVGPDANLLMERVSVLVVTTHVGGRSYFLLNDAARRFVLSHFEREALARIHRQCAPPLNPPAQGWMQYELRYGIDHALAAGDTERAGQLCCSAEFLTAKCRQIGIVDVLRDLQNWLAVSKSQDARRRRVRDILELITREQLRIQRTPEILPSLLYTWLRAGEGLTPQAIAKELRISEAPVFRVKRPLPKKSLSLERRGMKRHGGPVTGFQVFQRPQPSILSWSMDVLRTWDLASGNLLDAWQPHAGEITGCVMLPDGVSVLSSSRDGTLRVSNSKNDKLQRALVGHEGEVLGVALSRNAKRAVSWSADRTLRVWDVKTGRELSVLRGHEGTVTSGLFLDLEVVVSGSEDGTIRLWRPTSGELWQIHGGEIGPVTSIAADPNRPALVSGSQNRNLQVWRLEDALYLRRATLKGHTLGIVGCAFSPSKSRPRLASWSYDRTIRIWNPYMKARDSDSPEPIAVLSGHEGAVLDCAFSPGGQQLASCSADRTVRIWNVADGREVARFEGHLGAVRCCRFVSEQIVVSGSEDRTLRVWNLKNS